jgi:predicted transcriptional regulator
MLCFAAEQRTESLMTDLMNKALARVQTWAGQRQNDVAELLLALDDMGADPIDIDADTLSAIDEGLTDIAHGRLASKSDVEDVFARYRK